MRKPDPRSLLLISACISTMAVAINAIWPLACMFVFTILICVLFGVDMLPLMKKSKMFLGVIFVIALMESVFNAQGHTIILLGNIKLLTTGGLMHGAITLLRMATVLVSASLFTLATPRTMIQGLIQMKVPYEFAFMAMIALRFLPVFAQEFRETVIAMELRGIDFGKIRLREKVGMYGQVFLPVIYGATDRAQNLSIAMELRAFRAYPERTSRFLLTLGLLDYVIIIAMPALTVFALICNYVL